MPEVFRVPANIAAAARQALAQLSEGPARENAEALAMGLVSKPTMRALASYWRGRKTASQANPQDLAHGGRQAAAWLQNPEPLKVGRARKPAHQITDRALRYRARKILENSGKPQHCEECGSKRNLVADHRNGYEEDDRPENLRWLCKSCNTRLGAQFAKKGKGRRTNQYNPEAKPPSYAQYFKAMDVLKGRAFDMEEAAALDILHRTPKQLRAQYNRQAWDTRKSRYGHAGRQLSFDDVPF